MTGIAPRKVRFGIVVFPGSNCEYDAKHALSTFPHAEPYYLWHKDDDLQSPDVVILPGGFSYGDYLRTGAIARFSPLMGAVSAFAESGGLVLGICNGFQILTEAHMLHGAMLRNRGLKFVCRSQHLRVERTDTPFTRGLTVGDVIQVPVNHNEGAWTAGSEDLRQIEDQRLVVFRYCDEGGDVTDAVNPNGAVDNVAGIVNECGNVLGMMPHPERVCESAVGGIGGRGLFDSLINHVLEGM
ncbi:MAG TPA: phosphoribosylformylglycinamidine synthase subunit PurQ [Thermoleophilia bacterium]|nr:phosphoribosylformylglycinamidine synthase subunit PurQ [Thermoleophilia bacterium]